MKPHLVFAMAAILVTATGHVAAAGPFAPAAGQAGSTAVSMNSATITHWATGYLNYNVGTGVDAEWRTPSKALGKAVGDSFDIVTLGDGGSITLTFGGAITNGLGADFAVFENGFSDTFLELARVEVSSNGTQFFRFPAFSLTPNAVSPFSETGVDPTNIEGFAGKYRQGFGTPFDLDLFKNVAGLDVNNVRYVRIVDVIGNGSQLDDYPAIAGGPHKIYDPYPNTGSAGFDLDAVGVMHFVADAVTVPPVPPITIPSPVPEPQQFALFGAGLALLACFARRRVFGETRPSPIFHLV